MSRKIYAVMALAALLTTGCAGVSQHVNIAPDITVPGSTVGQGARVLVEAVDVRPSRVLGRRSDASGTGGEVSAHQDLGPVFQQKLIEGLRRHGFSPLTAADAQTGRRLRVEIQSVDYTSRPIPLGFQVRSRVAIKAIAVNGPATYENIYEVTSEEQLPVPATAARNEALVNRSVSTAFNRLMQDSALLNALAR